MLPLGTFHPTPLHPFIVFLLILCILSPQDVWCTARDHQQLLPVRLHDALPRNDQRWSPSPVWVVQLPLPRHAHPHGLDHRAYHRHLHRRSHRARPGNQGCCCRKEHCRRCLESLCISPLPLQRNAVTLSAKIDENFYNSHQKFYSSGSIYKTRFSSIEHSGGILHRSKYYQGLKDYLRGNGTLFPEKRKGGEREKGALLHKWT